MEIKFFMIVSGHQESVIADYAIRSFSKLTNLDFKLIVYSNYIEKDSKETYFPKWKQLDYVQLIENSHHDPDVFVFNDKILIFLLLEIFKYLNLCIN